MEPSDNDLYKTTRKLTHQQKKFVEGISAGLAPTTSARNAGFKFPAVVANRLMKTPQVVAAIKVEQGKYEELSSMTKKKVIDGLIEAVDMAKLAGEPSSMVAAWREIGKLCGYYAPDVKRIDISIAGAVQISQIEALSDEELTKLIIDGTAEVVDDDEGIPQLEYKDVP